MLFKVIEDPYYTKKIADLGETKRIDDAMFSVHWELARAPLLYPVIAPGSNRRTCKTIALGGLPEFTIVFEADESSRQVLLKNIGWSTE